MNRTHSLTARFLGSAGLMAALVAVMLQMTGVAQSTPVWVTKAAAGPATYLLGVVAGGNGKIYAIGGWYLHPTAGTSEYNPAADSWTPKASMPFGSSSAGVAESGGKIYVIGGIGGGVYTNRVEAYDPATDTWSARAPMSVSRDLLAAATTNGKIYAIGGRTSHLPTPALVSTVEEYDPDSDTWTTKAPMHTARYYFAAVTANNGKIYAIGGCTGWCYNVLNTIEEYDPTLDKWTTKSCMPVARGAIVAVAAPDDKIYVIGGYNPTYGYLTSVVRYDPQSDTWESGATPEPIVRSQGGAAMGGDKIYVMGGIAPGAIYRSEVGEYNPAADTWVVTPSDPTCGPPPDTTPPTIGVVSNLTAEATSAAGAVVTFALPTATDAGDSAPVVTASPASGSTFGLGTTTVTVTATDASGNSSTASFTVTVQDTTPPVIATHANAIAEATSSDGALVNYVPPAWTDAVSGTGPATCTPASGSTFPLGATTVTCAAADGAANLATPTSFTVTVQVTTAGLENLVMQFVTKAGVANSLISKLDAAEAAGARGNAQAMAGAIGAFINELQAQAGKSLTAEQAATLIALAQRL